MPEFRRCLPNSTNGSWNTRLKEACVWQLILSLVWWLVSPLWQELLSLLFPTWKVKIKSKKTAAQSLNLCGCCYKQVETTKWAWAFPLFQYSISNFFRQMLLPHGLLRLRSATRNCISVIELVEMTNNCHTDSILLRKIWFGNKRICLNITVFATSLPPAFHTSWTALPQSHFHPCLLQSRRSPSLPGRWLGGFHRAIWSLSIVPLHCTNDFVY